MFNCFEEEWRHSIKFHQMAFYVAVNMAFYVAVNIMSIELQFFPVHK